VLLCVNFNTSLGRLEANNYGWSLNMLFSPITSRDYQERIEKTKRMMADQGVDLMLVYASPWKSGNCRYLTGIRPSRAMMEVPEFGYGKQMLTLPVNGDPTL